MGFSKKDLFALGAILATIILVTVINLQMAIRRSRDSQRKSDIRSVTDALSRYQADFGFFPDAFEGTIAACGVAPPSTDDDFEFSSCRWGEDAIRDLTDLNYPAYVQRLPQDPRKSDGWDYLYISNGGRFQLYASLESSEEAEYSQKIIARNLLCGKKICNFGLSSGGTPLDITLEEYEQQKK